MKQTDKKKSNRVNLSKSSYSNLVFKLTDELAFYQHIDNRVREIKIAVSFKYYTK